MVKIRAPNKEKMRDILPNASFGIKNQIKNKFVN